MKRKIRSAVVCLAVFVMTLSFPMPTARASTFYNTFISSCSGADWFVSYVSKEFIKNGKRFSDVTSENDATLLSITSLDAPQSGINKIPEAVKFLKNLESVDLSYNEISDISPLYACTGIKRLNIESNLVSSVDTAKFVNLTELNASSNGLDSMPDFGKNASIKHISLADNNIKSVTSLSGLGNISYIDISGNFLSDVSALGAFSMVDGETVATLDISDNAITDLGFASSIAGLKAFYASNNGITQGLDKLPVGIERLDVSNNLLAEGKGLGALTDLRYIDISGNSFTNLSDIANIPGVVRLDASENLVADATGIANSTSLKSLDVSGNKLTALNNFASLVNLEALDISKNSITSLSGITAYASLRALYASHNGITDISAIAGLNKLIEADLGYNAITACSPTLKDGTPALLILKLSGNTFSAAEVANIFANGYPEIYLNDSVMTDKLPDMSQYPSIYELYLTNSALSANDISMLFKKQGYTGLGLGGGISDSVIETLKSQTDLLSLDVSNAKLDDGLFAKLAELNILELDASNTGVTVFPEALTSGSIKVLDVSKNKISAIPADCFKTAVSKGMELDISSNPIALDHVYYKYYNGVGVKADNLTYAGDNYDLKLTINTSEVRVNVGDTFDVVSFLAMNDGGVGIALPHAGAFSIKVSGGKSEYISVSGTKITVKSTIPSLDEYVISVSLKNTARENLICSFKLKTESIPLQHQMIGDVSTMYGVEIGTKLGDIYKLFKLDDTYSMQATDLSGNQLGNDDIAATGTVIRMLKNGSVVFERTLVVYGDCSGDGKINSIDYMMMKMHIFEKELLTGIYFEAADVYQSGVINSTDYMTVKMYLFNKGTISQERTKNT